MVSVYLGKPIEITKLAPFIGHTMPKIVLKIKNKDHQILKNKSNNAGADNRCKEMHR